MNALVGPATVAEIGEQVSRLVGSMTPGKNRSVDGLTNSYFEGLKGFPIDAIREAIDGLFSGRFGPQKWLPEAPELAVMVRSCLAGARGTVEGRPYSYRKPNSQLLKQGCTKEWVREMRRRGQFEPGVIWTPGTYGENPSWGDLWAPDPKWQPAVRIPTKEEDEAKAKAEEAAEIAAGSFNARFVRPGSPA